MKLAENNHLISKFCCYNISFTVVDFLPIAKFSARELFFYPPSSSFKQFGVLDERSTCIYFNGLSNSIEKMCWLSEKEIMKLRNNREPASAPSCSYFSPTPNQRGRLVWISGNISLNTYSDLVRNL